ncbi:MAG: TIGR03088 family PEP-CTERM/XrtA system glycosyltransferase [Gammaproteobacteria bacterium]|nr:TIGR03088 family PEP-CTERM/XrtA system glycosyltransferase [Gammaproteobacteria bacterium]
MKRRISIAHVIFRLDYGGLENGLVNLINRLPRAEFAHTVISLTNSTDFRRRLPEDVPVHELHKPPGNSPAYLVRIWKMLREGHYDVLHTRNLPCLESQLAGFAARVPVRIHGEHGWDMIDLHGTRPGYRALRRAFRRVVTRYVALSRHIESYLVDTIGVDPARVTRICNGVDTARFTPAPEGLPQTPFVVGSVGRVEPVKDYLTLARAFARLATDKAEAARLVIAGAGSERERLLGYLREAGLGECCELPGASDDVASIMQRFSVFVLPSLAEGISNTILEAMACGLPVIATTVGGNAELIVEGETGYLVPPGDDAALAARLRHYLQHPEEAARHGRAARERAVREFSLDVMVERYRRLYRDSVAAAGARGAAA